MRNVFAVALLVVIGSMVGTAALTAERCSGPSPAPGEGAVGRLAIARAAHQATALPNGDVLITGGCTGRGCGRVVGSTEIYRVERGTFQEAAPMREPRAGHGAVGLATGGVLVVGGWSGQSSLATAEIYDPVNGEFSAPIPMNEARMSATVTRLRDGRVLVAGGEIATGTSLRSAEIFDPLSGSFSAIAPMSSPRAFHTAVALADGRVLIAGGQSGRGAVLQSTEIFDPADDSFRPGPDLATPRHKHAAVALHDGRILVLGGSRGGRDDQGLLATTEFFDPESGSFAGGPTMRLPRYKFADAVIVLNTGDVLVAGGADGHELWNPGARGFRPGLGPVTLDKQAWDTVRFQRLADQGAPGAQFSTASRLPSGAVLVAGGYDARITPTSSAWVFRR